MAGCAVVGCGVLMLARLHSTELHGRSVPDAGVMMVPAVVADAPPVTADASLEDGVDWWTGLKGMRDIPRSYSVFLAACRDGNAIGCENALHVLFHSAAAKTDGLAEISRACYTKDAPCVAVALLAHDSLSAKRSCVAGVPSGCLVASLGSHPAERDPELRRVLDMPIDSMIDARFLRGFMLAFGLGMRRDAHVARKLVTDGCMAGDSAACALLECLDFDGNMNVRMNSVDACDRAGVLPEHLVQLAKDSLVIEALQNERK